MDNDNLTLEQFRELSEGLRKLAAEIPLHWGRVQNNRVDDRINMFSINSYEQLKRALDGKPDYVQNYLKRRWYLWQCSRCDEYLFYYKGKSVHNPNRFDKSWDVRFVGGENIAFDVKGTIVPREMRGNIEELLDDPFPMIKFYYDKQSTGRRYDMQNRLFVVHHSFVDEPREFYLRCAWGTKEKVYDEYADAIINGKQTYNYKNCISDVIFLIEREKNKIEYKF